MRSGSRRQQAAALARKDGEARLAQLRQAPADTALRRAPQIVSRAQQRDLPRGLLDAVLKAPTRGKLPAFVGVDLGAQGYAVAKITKVLGRGPGARRCGAGAGRSTRRSGATPRRRPTTPR